MKKQILIAALLTVTVQGVAHAAYPSDAEASYSMLDLEVTQPWGVSRRAVEPHNPFPFGGGFVSD